MQLIFGSGKNFFFSLKNQALGHIKLFYIEFTFSWFCASVVDLWWVGGGPPFVVLFYLVLYHHYGWFFHSSTFQIVPVILSGDCCCNIVELIKALQGIWNQFCCYIWSCVHISSFCIYVSQEYFFLIAHVYTRVKIISWSGHTVQSYGSFVIYVIFVCLCEWSGSKATIWIHVAVNYIGSFFFPSLNGEQSSGAPLALHFAPNLGRGRGGWLTVG